MKYNLVACGGTFDRLHQGHKDFLAFALSLSSKVIIGLTSDSYVNKYKAGQGIEPYDKRLKTLEKYVGLLGRKSDIEIVSLNDHFGPVLDKKFAFGALIVTEETEKTGKIVNTKRKELALPPLTLEIFKRTASFDGEIISSSRIRKEILHLPPTIRTLLQSPFGEVLSLIPEHINSQKTVTVGDATTQRFIESGIHPFLIIIDNKIGRIGIPHKEFKGRLLTSVKNAAGTITPELSQEVEKAFKSDRLQTIEVDGEEDLAVLPVLLSAPVGFTVYYGQPHTGLVEVIVTKKIKQKAKSLLGKFELLD